MPGSRPTTAMGGKMTAQLRFFAHGLCVASVFCRRRTPEGSPVTPFHEVKG
jgi:hypothetical protein